MPLEAVNDAIGNAERALGSTSEARRQEAGKSVVELVDEAEGGADHGALRSELMSDLVNEVGSARADALLIAALGRAFAESETWKRWSDRIAEAVAERRMEDEEDRLANREHDDG
jgi:hypothetical protein